eukprot:4172138-Karenia_brevis.AAC.1
MGSSIRSKSSYDATPYEDRFKGTELPWNTYRRSLYSTTRQYCACNATTAQRMVAAVARGTDVPVTSGT